MQDGREQKHEPAAAAAGGVEVIAAAAGVPVAAGGGPAADEQGPHLNDIDKNMGSCLQSYTLVLQTESTFWSSHPDEKVI